MSRSSFAGAIVVSLLLGAIAGWTVAPRRYRHSFVLTRPVAIGSKAQTFTLPAGTKLVSDRALTKSADLAWWAFVPVYFPDMWAAAESLGIEPTSGPVYGSDSAIRYVGADDSMQNRCEAEAPALMTFEIEAPSGLPRGSAVLTVVDPIRAYCARKTCLQPLLSKLAVIRFEGASLPGEAYLRTRTIEEWPHPSDVRDFEPGEELRLDFEMTPGGRFYLRNDGGEEIPRLPPGSYRSTACLDIDTWPEIAHLGLTEFRVCSETVDLVVE
jgi:hypothetical protein